MNLLSLSKRIIKDVNMQFPPEIQKLLSIFGNEKSVSQNATNFFGESIFLELTMCPSEI